MRFLYDPFVQAAADRAVQESAQSIASLRAHVGVSRVLKSVAMEHANEKPHGSLLVDMVLSRLTADGTTKGHSDSNARKWKYHRFRTKGGGYLRGIGGYLRGR